MSAFALEDGVVYHTYSAYARGVDGLWGMYQWLDRAPRGVTRRGSGFAATTSTRKGEPISEPLPLPTAVAGVAPTASARNRRRTEHGVYVGLAIAIAAAVVLGFWRTFFFKAWYPEWASLHGAPETIFYVHGVAFAAWLLLLLTQTSLVASGRVDLHRRLGRFGAGLAVVMVVLGTVGSLIAAGRPTGFIDVPVPPLQFLVVPLTVLVLFAAFVTLAVVNRRRAQSHKRYMILASIALIEAAIGRWPFTFMTTPSPVPGLGMIELSVDLFLVPMIVWDLMSRGQPHPVTLWGGAALIANQLLRMPLAGTAAWLAFAGWAVGLVSP